MYLTISLWKNQFENRRILAYFVESSVLLSTLTRLSLIFLCITFSKEGSSISPFEVSRSPNSGGINLNLMRKRLVYLGNLPSKVISFESHRFDITTIIDWNEFIKGCRLVWVKKFIFLNESEKSRYFIVSYLESLTHEFGLRHSIGHLRFSVHRNIYCSCNIQREQSIFCFMK